jgi:DNA-binding IclR family transcriptional regulator
MPDNGNHLKSVVRCFKIVETLESAGGLTLTEVTEKFEMPYSTAHVYLNTLVDTGYVVRDGNEYRLGFRFLKHGGAVRHDLDIYQAAKPEIDDLARRTGEVVDFGVVENGKRVLVYKSEGPDVVTQKPVTGDYAHMHMTALGKAMLSTFDDERVATILDEHGLPKATRHTIDSREELFAELDRIRERGYSVETEERRLGIRAVGTPIEHDAERPAAISISGPMSKLTDERIDELSGEIRDSVNVILVKIRNY